MQWQPYREPLRVTLLRTITVALVAGVLVARYWDNELVAQFFLQLRGRPSFYNGRG